MPKKYIDSYNRLIIEFMWNKKLSKIKYSTIIADIEDGDLKLQGLKSKIQALKSKMNQIY
jgi:hypothetical protein